MASRLATAVCVGVVMAASTAANAEPSSACLLGLTVVDGDTIAIDGEEIRLTGYDTPEIEPYHRCDEELELGRRAAQRLEQLLCSPGSPAVDVVRRRVNPEPAADRYKRALARVMVEGVPVGDVLVAEGLARRSKPRRGWCAVLGARPPV